MRSGDKPSAYPPPLPVIPEFASANIQDQDSPNTSRVIPAKAA